MSDSSELFILPGFLPRNEFARKLGVHPRTIKRRVDAGQVVERNLGRERLVDLEATAARMRGGDKPKRRRAA
jgi:hypothetical protein